MSSTALWLLVAYGIVGLVFRIVVQLRLTGSTGFIGISRDSPAELAAGVLFVASYVLVVAAPVLDLNGAIDPIDALDHHGVQVAGVVLAVAGILGTVAAQLAMGSAWRIGVDPEERTNLVTDGPFGVVRNPIYSAMIPVFIGIALMVGNFMGLAAVACAIVSLELQTRATEEPYLLRTHGDDYAAYAARVGRFVPGVGRIRS